MDSKDMTEHTKNLSEILNNSQDETEVYSAASLKIKRYYSLMDDECSDDVFIQPPCPPPCRAILSPTEGSTNETQTDSAVTLPAEAADATKAKANPYSLDRYHGEKQLMTARNEPDEVITRTMQSSMEPMDNTLLSNDMSSTLTDYQDQASMGGSASLVKRCYDNTGKAERNNTSEDEEAKETEDGPNPCNVEENYKAERDTCPLPIFSIVDEKPGVKTNLESDKNSEDISCFDERDLRGIPDLNKNYGFLSSDPSEINEFTNDRNEESINRSNNEEHVATRSSDTVLTESGLTISKKAESVEQVDGSWRIASDIQQGEQLLHRLQMVQLRHDDIPKTTQEVIKVEKAAEEERCMSEVHEGGVRGIIVKSEEDENDGDSRKMELKAKIENNENSDTAHTQTETRTSLLTPPGISAYNQITTNDVEDSSNDYCENLTPLTINSRETSCEIPFISVGHRFSAAETSIEKQIQEVARTMQNLQRAGGVFNLADNPDVLEIPFKTDVSLESLLTKACSTQQSRWQFSEKKMQKEITQEIQRELVLVNQGKISGEYCRGEVHQLKETKLLFEAFQQGNREGPTRPRKVATSAMKGPVYPSILERTRSLEMFSLKTCLVSRAHSLRLYNSAAIEGDKSPENLRSKSPTGGSRDKRRLSAYSKHDKHLRLHRSMDSISSESCNSAVEFKCKAKDTQESLILRENPFFKLRPAKTLQPGVEKDIREAKEREEELRRQRCTLYGEDGQKSEDEEKFQCTKTLKSDVKLQSRGKLERLWPPPSKIDQKKSGEQEAKVHRAGGQKAPLWQLWESGLINSQASDEKK